MISVNMVNRPVLTLMRCMTSLSVSSPGIRQLFANQPPLTLLSQSITNGTLNSVVKSEVCDGPSKATLDAGLRHVFTSQPPLTSISQSTDTGTTVSTVQSNVHDGPGKTTTKPATSRCEKDVSPDKSESVHHPQVTRR